MNITVTLTRTLLKELGISQMRRIGLICLILITAVIAGPISGHACSCAWRGPFLRVAGESLLVIRGRILRHHPGPAPSMDVLILETLKGGILDSGLSVQMGDGMLCRPSLEGFPPGSEWILALNGPGAKPGKGLALSHCGEYWLSVEKGVVSGSIDGMQHEKQEISLEEFKNRFR